MSGIIRKRLKNRARRATKKAERIDKQKIRAAMESKDFATVLSISQSRGWPVRWKKV